MVERHNVLVQGVDVQGHSQPRPMLLQMPDTDFPAHFLKALAAPDQNLYPSIQAVASSQATPATLFQPVQRMVHLAMIELNCDTLGTPPLATTRVQSAVLVVRRIFRTGSDATPPLSDQFSAARWAWMHSAQGSFDWVALPPHRKNLDPDPSKRPQLQSGRADLDQLLAAMSLSSAMTEVITPAFVAPPDICNALGRTIVYALIPTASSEVADPAQPVSATVFKRDDIGNSLPALLSAGVHNPIEPGQLVDARWMGDDFLLAKFPSTPNSNPDLPDVPNPRLARFQMFNTTVRMLQTVFGAFDSTPQGQKVFQILNRHSVVQDNHTIALGDFYRRAVDVMLGFDTNPAGSMTMPTAWDSFSDTDYNQLLDALIAALGPQAAKVAAPQGRFQDPSRLYTVKMFLRIKPENPACPIKTIHSPSSEPFRIAAWYESAGRSQPPIILPDPTKLRGLAKPNASFQVPAALMNAMQGSSLSGLMQGGGGGGGIGIDWICGFSIPLITICAFFVLNIFFSLLAIIFFWLPFFKICIPIPVPKSDGG